jgi:gentisate 1,2-dioxygenase
LVTFSWLDHSFVLELTQFALFGQAFYVIHGKGYSTTPVGKVSWSAGDLFVVPAGGHGECVHTCMEDATGGAGLYWVNDAPLLSYLGVEPKVARFEPAFFR